MWLPNVKKMAFFQYVCCCLPIHYMVMQVKGQGSEGEHTSFSTSHFSQGTNKHVLQKSLYLGFCMSYRLCFAPGCVHSYRNCCFLKVVHTRVASSVDTIYFDFLVVGTLILNKTSHVITKSG